MCYGHDERPPSRDDVVELRNGRGGGGVVVDNLRNRLAEAVARLERARQREAELSRELEQLKKFVRVMRILEAFLRRQYAELWLRPYSSSPPPFGDGKSNKEHSIDELENLKKQSSRVS